MKKSLSLLAIVCLVLSMGLVSQVLANAPVYPEVPSVKLYTNGQGLTPAFDLAWFSVTTDAFFGDKGTGYSVTTSFLGLSSVSASSFSGETSNVNQAGYSSATDGSNTFSVTNAGGTIAVSNKTKFSSYILYELPKVGLSVGESVTVPLYSYQTGVATNAPSFGNPNALIISDTTKVSAVWANASTAVTVTLLATTSSPVFVDVIASPVASGAIGIDQDKGRIGVYSNLLSNGTFSTAADTAAWGIQTSPGKSQTANDLATGSWDSTATDSAATVATGVWQFTFADSSSGVKATPFANYIPMAAGKWYTSRMRVFDSTSANSDQALLYSFSTSAAAGVTCDVAADAFVGIPTVWTWMEAPVYIHAANNGFPQFQFKAGAAGSVFLDEVQVIQATPKILDGTRGNVRNFFAGGLFGASTSTTLWGYQVYNAAGQQPIYTLTFDIAIGSALSANFTGAALGANLYYGFQWTGLTSGAIYTPQVTPGREAGASMQLDVTSGPTTGDLSIALIAAYGTTPNGGSAIDHLDAAAIIGQVPHGAINLQTVGIQNYPFMQLQFGFRADATEFVNFSNVDVISDTNDPNFGDIALFP